MGNGFEKEYRPDPEKARAYQLLYERYSMLGDFIENKRM
jgi:L-ribulokinase